jgi:DNA polymerase-3 subunit gamma/tau
MLSKAAFNSMLKTLEEPPEHVKFVLATTDPQKIPITVLSRCLQFNLKQLPPPIVAKQLEHVLGEEKIPFDQGAIRVLARAAHGSMRDALSLLDQAIAYGGGHVGEAVVRQMIGAVDSEFVVSLIEAIAAGDANRLFAEARAVAERNLSFDAASSSIRSTKRPSSMATHAAHAPHGSAVTPVSQFSDFARIRAIVVLPTPRVPVSR